MCRLFGLHAGRSAVAATFWLIGAPDSLSTQSHLNPDGAGIGVFDDGGEPVVDKQPLAAWQDRAFMVEAHELRGTTFVAHVRHASTGAHTLANTHPFIQERRLFAHNGVVLGLGEMDARLGELGADGLVHGQTDSERIFALITGETSRHGGDVSAGIMAAISWISDHVPVYALNLVLTTATELWALRYPATHQLFVLARPAGGTDTARPLEAQGSRMRARSRHLADHPSVVVASEKMDDDAGWRLMGPGELLHVDADLNVERTTAFAGEPRHLLRLSDLDPVAAASQHPAAVGPAASP